jgi:hypothetical protein
MPIDDQQKTIEPEHLVPESLKDVEIRTIPDKFYGAALAARIADVKKTEANPAAKAGAAAGPARKRSIASIVIVAVLLLLGVGGGFVYFNRQLLFKSPPSDAPAPEPAKPAIPPPPAAPTELSATAPSFGLVRLAWKDASSNEAGFRIERRDQATSYTALTNLPPNSTAYQDSSVSASATYMYRVIALNEGGESPASNESVVATLPPVPEPAAPPTLPPAGLDSDSDGLTDVEEPLYGANLKDPDTDHDTFLDGNEVFHLYNPASGKNAKLLETNLVKVVQSPAGWKMLVPVTWKADVSSDGLKGVFSSGNGETFSVALEDNPSRLSIMDWYLAKYPGTLSSQAVLKTTKSGVEGLVGLDPLTTYFPWGDKVLVFAYDLDGKPFVNYRTTYEMMQNSIALSLAPVVPESAVSSSEGPEPGALPSPSAVKTSVQEEETSEPAPQPSDESSAENSSAEGAGSSGSASGVDGSWEGGTPPPPVAPIPPPDSSV